MPQVECGFSGRISMTKRKGGRVTEDRTFNNVMLHYGVTELLRAMEVDSSYNPPWELARYVFLGTDDTPASRNNPGLLARSGMPGKENHSESFRTLNDTQNMNRFAEVTLYFNYPAGEATGTWYEVGLANTSDYSDIAINRALIRDENGVPNPLVVRAEESLDVGITLRMTVGVQEPVNQETYFNLELGTKKYTLRALNSDYWSGGNSKNVWLGGSPIKRIVALDASGDPISIAGGWTGSGNTTNTSINYTYDIPGRLMRADIEIPFGDNDEEIHGFAFGPSTHPEDWMFEAMFDVPLIKPANILLDMEVIMAMSIQHPVLPWDERQDETTVTPTFPKISS